MNDTQKAAVKKKIDALRAQVTPANFAKLATANSQDQVSAKQGGSLGIFPKGQMVPEFERAVAALKPGEISPVIQTQYGYHIIRRPTYDQIKTQLLAASKGRSVAVAESTYLAKVEQNGKIEVKKDAPTVVKALGNDSRRPALSAGSRLCLRKPGCSIRSSSRPTRCSCSWSATSSRTSWF
jgi:parvulin-like peptidyl-prolyl isomerase